MSTTAHLPGKFLSSDLLRDYSSKLVAMELPCISLLSHMMTSSNGNIFRVTGHLCGVTKASDAEL